jgi:hypothetical protein
MYRPTLHGTTKVVDGRPRTMWTVPMPNRRV